MRCGGNYRHGYNKEESEVSFVGQGLAPAVGADAHIRPKRVKSGEWSFGVRKADEFKSSAPPTH